MRGQLFRRGERVGRAKIPDIPADARPDAACSSWKNNGGREETEKKKDLSRGWNSMNTRPRVAPTTNLLCYMCSPFGYIRLSFVLYFLFRYSGWLGSFARETSSVFLFFFSINPTKLRDKSQGLLSECACNALKFREIFLSLSFSLSDVLVFAIREAETNRNFAHRRRREMLQLYSIKWIEFNFWKARERDRLERERERKRGFRDVEGRENVARVRPPLLSVGRHLIYCFNYIRIYR